jgi:DNA-binding NtrC family response regulator
MNEFRTTPSKANCVRKHRLLIGEANPALREYLLAVLWADGHEVVAMATGVDLMDTLAVSLHPEFGSGHFDLVISEARMLGAEQARMLRTFGDRAEVPPFVLTTVFRDKELYVKAKQFGALAVLDKPLDIDELRQIVNASLRYLTEERGSLGGVCLPERLPIWTANVHCVGDCVHETP